MLPIRGGLILARKAWIRSLNWWIDMNQRYHTKIVSWIRVLGPTTPAKLTPSEILPISKIERVALLISNFGAEMILLAIFIASVNPKMSSYRCSLLIKLETIMQIWESVRASIYWILIMMVLIPKISASLTILTMTYRKGSQIAWTAVRTPSTRMSSMPPVLASLSRDRD